MSQVVSNLTLVMPMLWNIPWRFGAFGQCIFACHADVVQHVGVQFRKLAPLMRERHEMPDASEEGAGFRWTV